MADERRIAIQTVDQEMTLLANLASPLRKIPSHLLRDIFSYAIPYKSVGMHESTLFAPWTLLRACRHWRDVCLAYGRLWSDLHLDIDYGSFRELPIFGSNDIALDQGEGWRSTQEQPGAPRSSLLSYWS
ncbi:hypothetical protein BDV98DRAFT_271212 [Pterulicium gracile]|uniref:F-box domain-containing protein n=1 Tax=Pterulicium gracile TaxID=1884261 RepID=A0A5C3Q7I1_9AGAR|nr:hypothetical protein BDV98DRAFT_271212 [Pterula gracilis]